MPRMWPKKKKIRKQKKKTNPGELKKKKTGDLTLMVLHFIVCKFHFKNFKNQQIFSSVNDIHAELFRGASNDICNLSFKA